MGYLFCAKCAQRRWDDEQTYEDEMLQWAIMASADKSSRLENVRDEPPGSTATVAWPGQACPPQFDLPPTTVLFIMTYP